MSKTVSMHTEIRASEKLSRDFDVEVIYRPLQITSSALLYSKLNFD